LNLRNLDQDKETTTKITVELIEQKLKYIKILQNMEEEEEVEDPFKRAVFGKMKMLKTRTNLNRLLLRITRTLRKTKMIIKRLD
jgi:nanoRNase/pAp phosphatase (c-di-AMP/oligoRNAs hydrolase)